MGWVIHFQEYWFLLISVAHEIVAVSHHKAEVDVVAVHNCHVQWILFVVDCHTDDVVASETFKLNIQVLFVAILTKYDWRVTLALHPTILVEATHVILEVGGIVCAHVQVCGGILLEGQELHAFASSSIVD